MLPRLAPSRPPAPKSRASARASCAARPDRARGGAWRSATAARGEPAGVVRRGADVEHPPLRRVALLRPPGGATGPARRRWSRRSRRATQPGPSPPGGRSAAGGGRRGRAPAGGGGGGAEASTALWPRLRARSTSGSAAPRTSSRLARPDLRAGAGGPSRSSALSPRRISADSSERGELLSPPPGDGLEPQPEGLGVPGLLEQGRLQRLLGREVGRLGVVRQVGPGGGDAGPATGRGSAWRLPGREARLQPLGELRLGRRLLLRAGDGLAATRWRSAGSGRTRRYQSAAEITAATTSSAEQHPDAAPVLRLGHGPEGAPRPGRRRRARGHIHRVQVDGDGRRRQGRRRGRGRWARPAERRGGARPAGPADSAREVVGVDQLAAAGRAGLTCRSGGAARGGRTGSGRGVALMRRRAGG